MWARHFRRHPPGDTIAHQLLARIGLMLEAVFSKDSPDPKRWYFWEPEGPHDDAAEDEAHRSAVMSMVVGGR